MAGYAASARLQGGVPHFVGGGAAVASSAFAQPMPAGPTHEVREVVEHVELVGRPLDAAIADWLASVGESWSQLTFFLFDPESWR